MPRKSLLQPKRKTYSRDLKARVIYQSETLGKSTTQIAIDLDMSLQVVQRVVKTYNEIGEVCRSRKYKGRAPLMSPIAIDVSFEWLYLASTLR